MDTQQTPRHDYVSDLYDALIESGKYDASELAGNKDNFRNAMSSKETRKAMYDWIAGNEDFDIGPYDTYEVDLASSYDTEAEDLKALAAQVKPTTPEPQKPQTISEQYDRESVGEQLWQPFAKTNEEVEYTPSPVINAEEADKVGAPLSAMDKAVYTANTQALLDNLKAGNKATEKRLAGIGNQSPTLTEEVVQGEDGPMTIYHTPDGRTFNNKVEATLSMEDTARAIETKSVEGLEQRLARLDDAANERREAATKEWQDDFAENYEAAKKGSLWDEVSFAMVNTTPQSYASSAMARVEGDPEYRAYYAAKVLTEGTINMIREAEKSMADGSGLGPWTKAAGRGFGDTFADPRTWDLGVGDLLDSTAVLEAAKAFDEAKGDMSKLTPAQRELLNAMAVDTAYRAMYEDAISSGYTAGSVTAAALPSIAQMMLGGSNSVSQLVTKGAYKGALKAAKGGIKNKALRYTTKALTKGIGNLGSAAFMTGTFGTGTSLADANRRMTGKATPVISESGEIVYGGREGAKDAGTALRKAYRKTFIEYYSEMLGGSMGDAVDALADVTGVTSLMKKAFENLPKKTVAPITEFIKSGQWHGLFGEYAEEVAGGALNAALVGDVTTDDLLSMDYHKETLEGLLPMSIAFGILSSTSYRTQGYIARKNLRAAQDALRAQGINSIDDLHLTTENTLSQIEEVANNDNFSIAQKQAIITYLKAEQAVLETEKGQQAAEELMSEENITLGRDLEKDLNIGIAAWNSSLDGNNEQVEQIKSEYEEARAQFDEKQLAEMDQLTNNELFEYLNNHKKQARTIWDYLRKRQRYIAIDMAEKDVARAEEKIGAEIEMGRAQGAAISPEEVDAKGTEAIAALDEIGAQLTTKERNDLDNEGISAVRKAANPQAAEDYLSAKAYVEGMYEGARAQADAVAQKAAEEVQSRTHAEDGQIYTATTNGGESVNVVRGKITLNADGTIDLGASDKGITIVDEAGNKKMISSRELKSLEVANGAEAQQVASETAKQTYLQKLEALFNAPTTTQLEQEAAELEEEQVQMDAANRAVQQAEIINGSNVAIEVNGTQYPGQVMIVEDGGAVVDFGRPIIYNGRRSRTHQIPVNELTNLDAIARETESQASAEQPQAQTTPDTQGSASLAEQPTQEEVDYDALLERDPAAYIEAYEAEFGAGAARQEMESIIAETRANIEKAQKGMAKASPNQRAQARRDIAAAEAKLKTYEDAYNAKYNAPKVEDSASLAEQSTPQEIEPSEREVATEQPQSPIENRIAEWLKMLGVPVKVYHSVDEIPNERARAAINAGQAVRGWYEPRTDEAAIYVPNLNSEAEVDEVFIHEVVSHKGLRGLLKRKKFDALCDKVWDMMSETDREFYMNYPGVNGDKRAAADEYMAHLAEKVDLTNEERTIWQSIVDFVKKALLGIKATLSDKDIEDLIRMSYREMRKGGEDVSLPTQEGEQALFSISTYEQSGREKLAQFVKKEVKSKRLTQQEGENLIKQMDALYEVCVAFKDKYEPFGNWSDAAVVVDEQGKPVFSVIKANGDYAMNLDFSLVCKKRRTLDAVFRRMIDRGIINNYELGQVDLAKINQIIREHGFETACRLCFVDAKRFRVAQVADAFCDMYNPLTKMSDKQLREVSKKEGNSTIGKTARMLLKHPENKVELSRENFMDSKGFEDMAVNSKEILKLYNAKKGTGGPKASYGDTQYMNDILGKKWTPESAYAVGGVRLQSFSDYVPRMVFDYMQMVADIAAKKLPVHSYTKEPIFAKQFGLTGIKINLSLVPRVEADGIAPGLDAEGNYVWQEGETYPYEEAIAIQNADGYKANCGTIAVGVSDAHIEKMLSDENIRMVIPYHKSGLNLIVAQFNNIDAFKDYTNEQNTRNADGTKLDEKQMKSHFNFNANLHEHGDPRKAAQNYLEWCDEMGYIPKFDKFRGHPNYYKLLEDFTTCVTENGVDTFVPQGPVTMTFPDENSAFGSIADLIEQGLEEDAVLEGNRQANLDNIVDDIVEEFDGAPIEESEDWGNKKDAKWGLRFSIKPEDIPEQFQPGYSAKNAVSAENEELLKEMAGMTSAQLSGGVREEYGYNCNSWLEAMAPVARRGEGFHYYQYVQGLLKAHYELDFAARLARTSDKEVVAELKQQFDGITDLTSVKLVQDAMLYFAKGVAFNSSTRFVRAVNKAAKERSEAIKEEMGRVLDVGTSMDVKRGEVGIEWVKETFDKLNKDEAVGALFERVYDVAKQLKLRVAITNLRGTTRGEYFGDFVRYDARMLNSNLTEDQTKASILLHELIHSVTSYAIYAANNSNTYSRIKTTPEMVKAVRILDGVYGTLKREGALDEMYAMTNVSEMVAELSNPAFREELKKRNLWQKIVDAIKTIFGLDRKTDDTMLTAASDALEYLLDNFDRAAYNRYLTLAMNTDTYGKMQNTFKNMEESVRFSVALTPEEQTIVDKAKANGTYLKAPNGKATNLNPKQWAQVRTEAFKRWFGDWGKAARIEKLRNSKSAEITGAEFQSSEDMKQYRQNALEYGKTFRGEVVNADTGSAIVVNTDSVKEVLHHDGSDIAHIQSVAAIPEIIKNGIYITTEPVSATASKRLRNAQEVHYYVCGLNIGGTPYTVKFVVAEFESGEKYYDHSLTQIEKGDLLNRAEVSSTVAESKSPISDVKDKRLLSILQTNSSKIIDENGEPKVVYHQTNAKEYVNVETGENWDDLDWQAKQEWEDRDDWDEYWQEQDFYEYSRKNARTTHEFDGFFFAPEYDEYHEYGERTIPTFLNIRKPATSEDYNIDGTYNEAGKRERERLQEEGFDGVIRYNENGSVDEYIAFEPNQIKSANENVGTFDADNNDIRFSTDWDKNTGYSQRANGDRISVRALEAEEEGTYTKGPFKRNYNVSEKDFEALSSAGIIQKSEWHHTGANFKKNDFFTWSDGIRAGGDVYYGDGIPQGSMAQIYQDNKKQISQLSKAYEDAEWQYVDEQPLALVPSIEDFVEENFARVEKIKQYLTEDERMELEQGHRSISNSGNEAYYRRLEHKLLDDKYAEIVVARLKNDKSVVDAYLQYYSDNIEYNKQAVAYNDRVEAYNQNTNGKENILKKIAQIFGVVAHSAINEISSKSRYDIRMEEWKREYERAQESAEEEIAKIQQKQKKWIDSKIKSGAVEVLTRIPKDAKPTYFETTNTEMNGRYGWFKATYKYNLPEYISGYKFANERLYDTYKKYSKEVRDLRNNLEKEYMNKRPSRFSIASMSPEQIEQGVASANSKQEIVGQRGEGIVDDVRFSIGRNRQEQMYNTLGKRRPELTDQEKKAVIEELDKIDDNKVINAAFHYFANGTIRIPEDMPKVEQAVKVASIAKVDPAAYRSPMELIDAHADIKIKDKRIDPDTVPTLSNKVDYGNGITVYDVEESEESRENMRKIINTHFGEESSPWCLLQGDGKGHLTPQSEEYWEHYSAYPKRVAFKDGKLSAFFASADEPTWWSRQDKPYEGIPVVEKLPDGSGRVGTIEFDEESREFGDFTDIHIGERMKSDLYEEWEDEDTLLVREVKDGDTIYCAEYQDGEIHKYAERNAEDYKAKKFMSFDEEGRIETIRENGVTTEYDKGQVFRASDNKQYFMTTWNPYNANPRLVKGLVENGNLNSVEIDRHNGRINRAEVIDERGRIMFDAEYAYQRNNGRYMARCTFFDGEKVTFCSWRGEGDLNQYREGNQAIFPYGPDVLDATEGMKDWTAMDAHKAAEKAKAYAEQRVAELTEWAKQYAAERHAEAQALYEQEMEEKRWEQTPIRFSAKRKSALETVSSPMGYQQTVISSTDGAKVLKNIDNAIAKYSDALKTEEKTFIGNIAKAVGAKRQGSNSQYATFEAVNGKVFTLRFADHNATVSNFDNHNKKDGISIVVTAQKSKGIDNRNGKAHIVEYFYDAIKLRKAEGKPLVEILKSIKQAMYSGEYKDTTGLAVREEVNPTRLSVATTPSEEQYSVKEAYDNRLSKRRTKLREGMMDDGIAIKILQDLIAEETGEPIADIANVYLHRNHMNSRSTQEIGYYEQKFGARIMEALRRLIKSGAKLKDIEKYLIAKHGLERNDYMNWREAVRKAAEQKRKKELKDYDNLVTTAKELGLPKPESKVKSVGEYEREYFAQYNEAIANLSNEEYTARRREIMNSIVPYNFSEGHDQSGLTETLGYDPEKEDAVEYDVLTEEAHRIVEQFESEYNTAMIEELWDSIKASAGFSLTKNRNTGQISNEYHDNASKMYRYYVPLRGWEENKAEDVYAYEDVPNTGTTNRADLKAAGRRSKPDSPFATLANMAYTAIVQGNKNRANMSLLNLARMYPSDALSVHRIWEVLDEDTGDWVVAEPKLTTSNAHQGESGNEALNWAVENGGTVAADLAAYEEEMKALQKEGKARPVTGKIDSHLHFTNQQLKQHAVTVRVNGTPYIVWVNGNPRVAQTLNGLTRKQLEDWQRGVKAMTRWLSSVFTSKNPAFWVANGSRDLWYSEYRARTMFGMEYATRYTKNYGIVAAKIWELQRNGQLNAFDPSEDMGKIQQYYNEFIRNGGPTGYAYLKDVQELKGEMQTALKDMEKSVSFRRGWEKFDKNMDAISGAIETIPRLAAYITSRESGRSILDSISDAKEVTTNFDRKGGRLNQSFGVAWAFFNASVQGVQNFLNTVKEHPVKATMEIAGRAALGVYGVNILNMALAALFGDDPDEVMDQYFALSDYTRRHNLCFYIGGDWVKIPLPQTLRVFYGIGDIINKAAHGYAHYDNIPADIASLLGDFFPINLVGAENWTAALPTALSPIAEALTNTDHRGMPIANQTIFNKHLPEWQRTYGDESAPAVLISRALSRLSGGSKYKRGAIEFNPAYIDHLVKGYLGGVGTFITKGANTIEWGAKELAEKVSGGAYQNPEEFMWRGTPISSRLLQDAPTGDNNFRLNQAYSYWRDFYEKHNTQKRGYEDELESGNLEDVDDFIKVMMDEGTMEMFHDLDREIRKLYKEKDKMEDPDAVASVNEVIKNLKQRAVQMMEDEYFSDKKKPVFQERLRVKAEEKKRKASEE